MLPKKSDSAIGAFMLLSYAAAANVSAIMLFIDAQCGCIEKYDSKGSWAVITVCILWAHWAWLLSDKRHAIIMSYFDSLSPKPNSTLAGALGVAYVIASVGLAMLAKA